jgi:hypothetical protein
MLISQSLSAETKSLMRPSPRALIYAPHAIIGRRVRYATLKGSPSQIVGPAALRQSLSALLPPTPPSMFFYADPAIGPNGILGSKINDVHLAACAGRQGAKSPSGVYRLIQRLGQLSPMLCTRQHDAASSIPDPHEFILQAAGSCRLTRGVFSGCCHVLALPSGSLIYRPICRHVLTATARSSWALRPRDRCTA